MNKSALNWLLVTVGLGLTLTAAPQTASAAIRFGVDGIWVPLATSSVEKGNRSLDSTHKVASFGASAHGGMGFNIFSMNLKLNYFNDALELETDDGEGQKSVRRNQLDINAMARVGVPGVDIGIFGEGGASMSTEFDGLGYNFGLGAEYGLFSLPLMTFNIGLEGQYLNLPATLNNASTDSKSIRMMMFLGADFGP